MRGVDISDPLKPTSLVVIHGVTQQLERPETGTIFLLGSDGLTVIRHLSMEEEYQQEINQTTGPTTGPRAGRLA
jgi:hypothetical protein